MEYWRDEDSREEAVKRDVNPVGYIAGGDLDFRKRPRPRCVSLPAGVPHVMISVAAGGFKCRPGRRGGVSGQELPYMCACLNDHHY